MAKKKSIQSDELVKLRKRKTPSGNTILYLDYTLNGERVRESTGLSLKDGRNSANKDRNIQILAKAEAARLAKEKDLLYGVVSKDNLGNRTLFLPYYRALMEDRRNDVGNYGNWRSCLRYLEVYCSEKTTFGDITPRWVLGFKNYLDTVEKDTYKVSRRPEIERYTGLAQSSKISYFNKLRACLNQAYKEGIITSNPAEPIKGFKQVETERQYLTIEEVKLLAQTECRRPELKRAFLFACFTGLRKSDIEKLTWNEVQRFGDYTRLVYRQKKTGGQEYLDIPRVAEQYLIRRPGTGPNDRVFPYFKYGAEVSLELRRWALDAGITKDFTFHCSRHTFAVMLLNSGTDIYTVSKLLGHREIATTQIYAHLVDAQKQAAVSRITNIFDNI